MPFNNFDKFADNLDMILADDLSQGNIEPVINSLISVVLNCNREVRERLQEDAENDDLVRFVIDLNLDYGIDLEQRINRMWKGPDWWSNIKTDTGIRSGNAYFQHELTLDYDRQVTFNSNIESTFTLIEHLLRQVKASKNTLGEDIFSPFHKQQIEEVEEQAAEVLNDIEEHLEKYEGEINQDQASDDEDTRETAEESSERITDEDSENSNE